MKRGPQEGDVVMLCPHARPGEHVTFGRLAEPMMINGPDGALVETNWVATCEACYEREDRGVTYAIEWPANSPLQIDALDAVLDPTVDPHLN